MNQRVVLGLLIAGGLGIGLFAVVERVMRRAGRTETKVAQEPPSNPVELVSAQPRKPEPPRALPVAGMKPVLVDLLARPPAAPQGQAAPAAAGPVVEKLAVCRSVNKGNPVGEASSVSAKAKKVYACFRIAGAKGRKVRTVWTLNGKTAPDAWLPVTADTFRASASRKLSASSAGAARVEVQDEQGKVLATKDFTVTR